MSNSVAALVAAKRKQEQGDLAGAEQLYRQVLAASPKSLPAARALAGMMLDADRYQAAADVLTPALRHKPDDPELLALSGRLLYAMGRSADAAATLEHALARDPRSLPARIWLARCRTAAHRAGDAVAMLLPLLPSNDPMVHWALGQAYAVLARNEEAASHFRAAISLRPTASLHTDLGTVLRATGLHDEALAQFDAALTLDPRFGPAIGGKAVVLADRGAAEQARSLARSAIDSGIVDAGLALAYTRVADSPGDRHAAGALLDSVLQRPAAPADRCWLLYARAGLHEKDGKYDAAFGCFRAANQAFGSRFDPAGYQREIQELIDVFSREALAGLPRNTDHDALPIFIIGMPRSGTSLVEQILASHPLVHGGGELEDLTRLVNAMPSHLGVPAPARFPRCVGQLTHDSLGRMAGVYLQTLRGLGGGARHVTDKMPQNYLMLGMIDLLFPGTRVVHCVRHPLDTCLSCYTTLLSERHAYRTRLSDLAAVYRGYRQLMDHWRSVVRVPILDLRYEDLIAEPERVTRELLGFVGLPWNDRCLKFHENTRRVATASAEQVRRPIYRSSAGRWKRYERHLSELTDGLHGLYEDHERAGP